MTTTSFFRIWRGWNRFSRRQKLQTAICIVGLSVGMACYALSMLWIRDIQSYESFVPDADRVFVAGCKHHKAVAGASTYNGDPYIASVLKSNIPEVESTATIQLSAYYRQTWTLNHDVANIEVNVNVVDSAFIDMFGIRAVQGDLASLTPGSIALSRSLSRKLFGTDNAVGKTVGIGQQKDRLSEKTVCAVIPDWPKNSQFGCDVIMIQEFRPTAFHQSSPMSINFVKLRDANDAGVVERKIEELAKKLGILWELDDNRELMPIKELKSLYPPATSNASVNFSYIRVFMIIGILVIVCALVNYMLVLINSLRIRSHNVAMHRLFGAGAGQLTALSALDTTIILILSSIAGMMLIIAVAPTFRTYAGINIPTSGIMADAMVYLLSVVAVGTLTSALTTYAVMRQGQKSILHGHRSHNSSSILEKTSNVIQFASCSCMLICVGTMMMQLRYLTNTPALGFERKNIVSFFTITPEIKQKVLASPLVTDYIDGYRSIYPIYMSGYFHLRLSDDHASDSYEMESIQMSEKLYDFWGMTVVEGRLPRPNANEVMINETACRTMGLGSPVGQHLYWGDDNERFTVTGVMADLYRVPPTQTPPPAVFVYAEAYDEPVTEYTVELATLSVKIRPGSMKEFMDYIKPLIEKEQNEWTAINEDTSRMWHSTTSLPTDVEEKYNDMLTSERLLAKLMWAMALCGIVVSIFNAYSSLSLSLEHRRKEIVLRKINGAKPRQIIDMFLTGYMKILAVATLIGVSAAFVAMTRWLEGFQKHIDFPWSVVGATFLLMAAIITATIYRRIYRAAKINEASALKEL